MEDPMGWFAWEYDTDGFPDDVTAEIAEKDDEWLKWLLRVQPELKAYHPEPDEAWYDECDIGALAIKHRSIHKPAYNDTGVAYWD